MNELLPPLQRDPRDDVWNSWPGAVLLSDEILYYCTSDPKLIDPFDPLKNLDQKPARCLLRLGNEAIVGGRLVSIDEKHPLRIPANQVAIVRTLENVNLPRFLIARWSLTVGYYYQGLLWTGAPQVDPGWRGYLPCPLYNLSNQPITIKAGAQLFTMDFVRTTKYSEKSLEYDSPGTYDRPYNPPMRYYDRHNLRSAPYEQLKDLEDLTKFRNLGFGAIGLIFVVLTIIITVLSIITVEPVVNPGDPLYRGWPFTALIGSAVAVLLSVGSLILSIVSVLRSRRH
jgi:deoxycytidine triphosphate deaminase